VIVKLRRIEPEIAWSYHEVDERHSKANQNRHEQYKPPHIHEREYILEHLATAGVVVGYCYENGVPGTYEKGCSVKSVKNRADEFPCVNLFHTTYPLIVMNSSALKKVLKRVRNQMRQVRRRKYSEPEQYAIRTPTECRENTWCVQYQGQQHQAGERTV